MTTPTDLDVLIQACRNVKNLSPPWWQGTWRQQTELAAFLHADTVRREYNRLLRLKKKRKRAA